MGNVSGKGRATGLVKRKRGEKEEVSELASNKQLVIIPGQRPT